MAGRDFLVVGEGLDRVRVEDLMRKREINGHCSVESILLSFIILFFILKLMPTRISSDLFFCQKFAPKSFNKT